MKSLAIQLVSSNLYSKGIPLGVNLNVPDGLIHIQEAQRIGPGNLGLYGIFNDQCSLIYHDDVILKYTGRCSPDYFNSITLEISRQDIYHCNKVRDSSLHAQQKK